MNDDEMSAQAHAYHLHYLAGLLQNAMTAAVNDGFRVRCNAFIIRTLTGGSTVTDYTVSSAIDLGITVSQQRV